MAKDRHTLEMGILSCPPLKTALLHSPAMRARAVQVGERLSKVAPGETRGPFRISGFVFQRLNLINVSMPSADAQRHFFILVLRSNFE